MKLLALESSTELLTAALFLDGRIVETGSHDELLARRGAYWRLYQLQFERSEEPERATA